MFTGIVEEVGKIFAISRQAASLRLIVACRKVIEDAQIGDSISVNGVCLTITDIKDTQLAFDVVPETVRNSDLAQLSVGSFVNLERAMAANGRFGGHVVSGHVDTTAILRALRKEANAWILTVNPHMRDVLRYMVPRGSVTLSGISLTVNDVTDDSFTVSIIPHTYEQTVLRYKSVGDRLNIEVDILAKYVERLLLTGNHGQSQEAVKKAATKVGIDRDYLAEHGFMG